MNYQVFLDNGVLRNCFSQPKKNRRSVLPVFSKELDREIRISGNETGVATFISTPFMLLEYIGCKLSPLICNPAIFDTIKTIVHEEPAAISQTLFKIFKFLENQVENHEVSDYEKLKRHFINQQKYQVPNGKVLAERIFGKNLEDIKTRTRFIQEIALDEMQGLDFAKIFQDELLVEEYNTKFMIELSASILTGNFNVSVARIVGRTFTKDGKKQVQDDVYEFTDLKQERVDTQLIHFASVGFNSGGRSFPVLCFTSERLDQANRDRVEGYQSYINHLRKIREPRLKPQPGRVFQVETSTGRIINSWDLSKF